jgi:acid phosphatase
VQKLALISLVVVSACVNTSGNTSVACQDLSAAANAAPSAAWGGSVFTIVMENHSVMEIFGGPYTPYIKQLAAQGAVAMGYHDPFVHPSEPNYLWMVAGQNFGILDDGEPAAHSLATHSHLADQLELAGLSWRSYQESMGSPCGVVSHGRYAAKHNPFVYFDDINGWDGHQFQPSARCDAHVVDYSALDADLAAGQVPRYAFITPNLDNDMHDGSLYQGDQWLAREVPKILASPAFTSGGVLFLLWDEGSGTLGPNDDPPFLVVSPHAKVGYSSTTNYDTSSYLKTVQTILGLQPLPCADPEAAGSVEAMTDLFTVPLSGP